MSDLLGWLLDSGEPWTRYRALVDLAGAPEGATETQAARAAMLAHPHVRALTAKAAAWGEQPMRRHNDAGHPLYALSVLADMGVTAADAVMEAALEAVVARQSDEGAFQTLLNIPAAFGGSGSDQWSWMACDTPTLLYVLLAMGLGGDLRVQRAATHLAGLAEDNGWRCRAAAELGRFRGPGRKEDPCPIANVYALRALSLVPEQADSQATRAGVEMLLGHWERRAERKYYLFGAGTDFRKLKYPFVWYDILHVVEALSRFPFVHADPRFLEMLTATTAQADGAGRYAAGSMYRAWKGWSFADKSRASPWLTFLVLRIRQRVASRA